MINTLGRWLLRLLRGGVALAVLLLMLLALYVSVGRELTPMLAEYQSEIETKAQQTLGLTLRIGRLEGSWRHFAPVLLAHDVTLGEAASALHLETVRVIPDVLGSLLSWELKIADLQVDGLRLNLLQGSDGQWTLAGLPARDPATPALSPALVLGSLQRVAWLSLINSQ
ncbi:MAG: AsmA family protein, partial [Pseudomonadaceae bacterium]|nr:AsmA family protein [Pseudomonadaceae bacterium]